ncbi:rho guanine nucleotide exchange factor 38-like isoform X2 [Halichondria panicea]|uniref:rho guanine nucleotide exchange factor 38-like isoform X2 n=1 Tax=Halichondria panicea TaxID=6063 RepID=UPI00312B4600
MTRRLLLKKRALRQIAELQHSPTRDGKKVWTFDSPDVSPVSIPRSEGLSGSPSPDVTPIALRERNGQLTDSIPPSPACSTVSSTLHQLASRLRGTQSTAAIEYPGNERRYMIISEIIDTERRYIASLEILLSTYLPALENVVAARDLRLLFPAQLEPLVERHSNLLVKLEERMSDNTLFPGIVGDIFARLLKESNTDILNMYSAYMNEFKVAMATLARYEQDSVEFHNLLLLCQHSPSCEGLSLASYLLTPIQRLPRYELLLKELLRQTPMDHPDNFYVSDAIDLIHHELLRLNQSIKSCQQACSVRRVSVRSKASFRARTEKAIAKLKRHVSIGNIDGYSSGDSSNGQEVRRSRTVRRRRNLKPSPYRSEENLVFSLEDDPRTPLRVKSMYNINNMRAGSLVDLMSSYNGEDAMKRKPSTLTPLASLPTTPEPSPRPTSPSVTSMNPVTSEDGSRARSRVSVYSTTSSTSGIGSIENFSQLDLRIGASTPTQFNSDPTRASTPVRNRVSFQLDSPPLKANEVHIGGASVVARKHKKDPSKQKKRASWGAKAFKLLSRKKSFSASRVLDIGAPKDFRHVQHGFPTTVPEGTEAHNLSRSNTGSSNTLTAANL